MRPSESYIAWKALTKFVFYKFEHRKKIKKGGYENQKIMLKQNLFTNKKYILAIKKEKKLNMRHLNQITLVQKNTSTEIQFDRIYGSIPQR